MKLLHFKAEGVHEYLNYDFKLDEKLTFLIGINGSGKTSVLKLILGIVSPSFNYLNSIDHKFAQITCTHNEKTIVIKSELIQQNKLKLSVTIDDEKIVDEIKKLKKIDGITSEEFRKISSQHIDEFENLNFTKKLLEFKTPFFLGLDRRIYEGQQIDKNRMMYSRKYIDFPINDHLNRSLIEIQEVIYDYYRLIASEQPRINSEFKNNVLLQTFEFIETRESNVFRDKRDLAEKREKATEAFKNLKVDGIVESLNKFFDSLNTTFNDFTEIQKKRKNTGDYEISDIEIIQKWFNNQPQLKKIDSLIEFNKTYQNELQKLYEPIEKTKLIINEFFKESKKELIIDAKGEIKIKLRNDQDVNIYELSSGEKQIIILLGNLIYFVEKSKDEPGIFIIDEPEISLHLSWQEIFVKSLINASPNTQFIIATHSPAIIGEYSQAKFNDLATLNI